MAAFRTSVQRAMATVNPGPVNPRYFFSLSTSTSPKIRPVSSTAPSGAHRTVRASHHRRARGQLGGFDRLPVPVKLATSGEPGPPLTFTGPASCRRAREDEHTPGVFRTGWCALPYYVRHVASFNREA